MDGPGPEGLFLGDLDDPWVAAIVGTLPRGTVTIPCAGDWPERWPDLARSARVVLLHRATLSLADAERLRRLRPSIGLHARSRLILCVGPHVRYHLLERCAPLVDLILSETTAAETAARHLGLGGRPRPAGPRPSVAVVSTSFELRQVLAESCRRAGYPAEPARDWDDAPPTGPVLWDVPVLEDDWPRLLADQARARQVVALIGFADRARVARARAAGASACLDLPCDPADLAYVLDRLTAPRPRLLADPGHAVPPGPVPTRPAAPVPI